MSLRLHPREAKVRERGTSVVRQLSRKTTKRVTAILHICLAFSRRRKDSIPRRVLTLLYGSSELIPFFCDASSIGIFPSERGPLLPSSSSSLSFFGKLFPERHASERASLGIITNSARAADPITKTRHLPLLPLLSQPPPSLPPSEPIPSQRNPIQLELNMSDYNTNNSE